MSKPTTIWIVENGQISKLSFISKHPAKNTDVWFNNETNKLEEISTGWMDEKRPIFEDEQSAAIRAIQWHKSQICKLETKL